MKCANFMFLLPKHAKERSVPLTRNFTTQSCQERERESQQEITRGQDM